MGCKTCESKKQNRGDNQTQDGGQNNDGTINLIPQEILDGEYGGNFWFKFIAFIVVVIALPFIMLVLVCQIFLTFFFPKSLPKVSKKFKNFLMSGFKFFAGFKVKREIRKREKQFNENMGYEEGSKLLDIEDIEVYKDNNKKK